MDGLLNQSCRIYKTPGNPDKFGKVTWGGFDTVVCRFVKTFKHYKNNQGNDVGVTCKFQVADRSVDVGTKIEFESKSYLVVDCKEWRDEDGELFGCLCYCSDYPTA